MKDTAMKKSAFVILLLSLTASAPATEWLHVSTAKNGLVVWFDLQSVKITPGAAQVWMKFDSSKVAEVPFPEAKALWKIDCLNDTQTALSTTSYDENGSVRATGTLPDVPASYEPIVPESYGATMRNMLCPYSLGQMK